MARYPRPTRIKRRKIMEGKAPKRRIIIEQPPDRPLQIVGSDAIRPDARGESPAWMVVHRRGVHRPKYGVDPLEARAVSKERVRGFLRERIVHRFLTWRMRFMEGVDFTFQSSMMGGRLELGGMVADFVFPILMIVLNVDGPTHTQWERAAKDKENEGILADMGYESYSLRIDEIDDEYTFEQKMRMIFNLGPRGGGQGGSGQWNEIAETDREYVIDYYPLYSEAVSLGNSLDMVVSRLQQGG